MALYHIQQTVEVPGTGDSRGFYEWGRLTVR